MTRYLLGLALGAVLLIAACEDLQEPPTTGAIALRVIVVPDDATATTVVAGVAGLEQEPQGHLEKVRATLQGTTQKQVTVTPSGTEFVIRFDSVTAGNYTVTLEGLVSDSVDYYGQTSGISVTAGQTTTPTVIFVPFRPVLGTFTTPTVALRVLARWSKIAAAQGYTVQFDRSAAFSNPTAATPSDTSQLLTLSDSGTHYVRVRAQHTAVPAARWSASQSFRLIADTTGGSTPASAAPLGFGDGSPDTLRALNVMPSSPQDWFRLTACANDTLQAETYASRLTAPNTPSPLNTLLRAYRTDSSTLVGSNDNIHADTVDSRIRVTLTQDGTYLLRVTGVNNTTGHYVMIVRVGRGPINTGTNCTQPPLPPTTLTATVVLASQIDLSWTDNSNNETGFRIEGCGGGNCSTNAFFITNVAANITTYQNTGLVASGSYTYRVQAYNVAGSSAYSNEVTAVTSAPLAPSGLTATTVSGSQINLAWTDNSANESGFKIEACGGLGCVSFAQIAIVGPNVTTYQNTGLAPAYYSYQVRAYNGVGNSAYTNTATASTIPPAAPTALSGVGFSSTQIDLSWTDNSANESGFRIERCADAGCSTFAEITTVGADVTTYQNTGVTATAYSYRVRAFSAAGNSTYSNIAVVPAAPTNLTAATASISAINLTWADNSSNEDGFRIWRCDTGVCADFAEFVELIPVGPNIIAYLSGSLAAGTSYSYLVESYTATGTSALSNTATAATPTLLTSGAPVTNLSDVTNSDRHYAIFVPASTPGLKVTLSGGTPDADLYLKFGNIATSPPYNCVSISDTSDEVCEVTAPASGYWYIRVRGFTDYTGVTLVATNGITDNYGYPAQFAGTDFGWWAAGDLGSLAVTVTDTLVVTHLGVIIHTAGTNMKLGLYTNAAGAPGNLITQATGSVASSGVKEFPVTQATILPGTYWIATLSQVNNTYVHANLSLQITHKYRAGYGYANPLPSPFGAASTATYQAMNYYVKGYRYP